MYQRVKQLAEQEGRSMANFVEFHLKRSILSDVGLVNAPPAPPRPRQVHLEEAIAQAVKRGPIKTAKHK
jgi:hypothetical protein